MAKMGQQGKIVHFSDQFVKIKTQNSNNDIVFQDQRHILVWSLQMNTILNKQTLRVCL